VLATIGLPWDAVPTTRVFAVAGIASESDARALSINNFAFISLVDFSRAIVRFRDGSCGLTVERSIFGYSVYTTGIYAVELGNGRLTSSARGGSIGRLQIHPQLMKYAGFLFADLVTAMQREAKELSRIGSIEFHDKEVIFAAPR